MSNFPKTSFTLTPEQLEELSEFSDAVASAPIGHRYAIQGNVLLSGMRAGTVDCYLINEAAFRIINEAIERARKETLD